MRIRRVHIFAMQEHAGFILKKGSLTRSDIKKDLKKRDMKAKMKMLLELPCTAEDWNEAAEMGVDMSEIDNETAMLIGLFKEAKSGNVQAVKEIRNILGKDNSSEELALKKKELKMKEEAANNTPEDTSLHITIDYGDENESESTG